MPFSSVLRTTALDEEEMGEESESIVDEVSVKADGGSEILRRRDEAIEEDDIGPVAVAAAVLVEDAVCCWCLRISTAPSSPKSTMWATVFFFFFLPSLFLFVTEEQESEDLSMVAKFREPDASLPVKGKG